jgi:hypothetical protein
MYVHHTIIRRIFLLYPQSLRSVDRFAGLFLRRLSPFLSSLILLKHFSLFHMTSFFFYFHTFIMISLLSRFYNKIDSIFLPYHLSHQLGL